MCVFYDISYSAERIKVQVWICTKKEFYNGKDYFFPFNLRYIYVNIYIAEEKGGGRNIAFS